MLGATASLTRHRKNLTWTISNWPINSEGNGSKASWTLNFRFLILYSGENCSSETSNPWTWAFGRIAATSRAQALYQARVSAENNHILCLSRVWNSRCACADICNADILFSCGDLGIDQVSRNPFHQKMIMIEPGTSEVGQLTAAQSFSALLPDGGLESPFQWIYWPLGIAC